MRCRGGNALAACRSGPRYIAVAGAVAIAAGAPGRVPFVPWFPLISVVLCGGLMTGLTVITWIRFVVWLGLGLLIYCFYSRHHSEFAARNRTISS